MPKQVWKIERFDGGLSTSADPRDIDDNELVTCTNFMVDKVGIIRPMGSFVAHDAGTNSAVIEAGFGLHYFAHDRLEGETTGAAAAETGDSYLALTDADGAANIDIYSFAEDTWGTAKIDLGSTTGMQVCFFNADGALRVSDGNFGPDNKNMWYGYIERTHFNGISPGGAADAYDSWYSKAIDLAKPTRGLFGDLIYTDDGTGNTTTTTNPDQGAFYGMDTELDAGVYICISTSGSNTAKTISNRVDDDTITTATNSGNWASENIRIYPPAGDGFNIDIIRSGTGGTWTAGDYEIGTTFIYDGNQESLIFENVGDGDRRVMTTGSGWSVTVLCTSAFDPFIIGGRVYIRKYDTDDPWILLADISLKDGIRPDLTSTFTAWSLDTVSGVDIYCTTSLTSVLDPSPWTYEAINGYPPDESISIGANGEGFKTAVVANRQTYIGNVRREGKDGVTRTEGDAMYKSMPGKFDTFPLRRKIEVSVQDGDEIVKLEEYADRILQFKKRKMHLINISQDIEFLEDTFMHKGVDEPGAVCKTDFGIAWVNELGVYLYDGKSVRNLLEKKGRQVINDWPSFAGGKPMIGYIPKKRQVIVTMSAGTGSNGDIYLFDMVTQSWVYGREQVADTAKQSNFTTDLNGDLIYSTTSGAIKKWDDASVTSSAISLRTKDIDFGDPSARKKIYKVYVSYKGDGRAVTINYSTNGDNDTYTGQFYRCNADGSTTGATASHVPLYQASVGTDDWINAELKPTASINNIKSFQLKFDGDTTDANFRIGDITIVYRIKNIK